MLKQNLDISPIFTGLTRPPMMLGITLDYLGVSCLFSLCLFVMAGNPFYLLSYLPLHVFGYLACKSDPNIFGILMKRVECLYMPNRSIWGCQSYEPF